MSRSGIRSRKGTAMSGDGTEYEYPDEAGYPDGMGTLHEGTEDAAEKLQVAGLTATNPFARNQCLKSERCSTARSESSRATV